MWFVMMGFAIVFFYIVMNAKRRTYARLAVRRFVRKYQKPVHMQTEHMVEL